MVRKELTNVKGKAYYVAQRAKYLNYAKEALAAGDRILNEYNMQYAEHFSRIIAEKFPQVNTSQQMPKDEQSIVLDDDRPAETQQPEAPRRAPIRRKRFCKKPQLQEISE